MTDKITVLEATAPSKRARHITLRLPESESKHLIFLIAVASMTSSEKVTIKDYMANLAIDAAKRGVKPPPKKLLSTVRAQDVARRVSVQMTPEIYSAIDKLRGTPTLVLTGDDAELVQNVDYGDADLLRELLEIEYRRQVQEMKKA